MEWAFALGMTSNMLYIQQSLNPNEEIIKVGHFHWWYTFSAALWLVFGVIAMGAILYGAYFWEIQQFVSQISVVAIITIF